MEDAQFIKKETLLPEEFEALAKKSALFYKRFKLIRSVVPFPTSDRRTLISLCDIPQ